MFSIPSTVTCCLNGGLAVLWISMLLFGCTDAKQQAKANREVVRQLVSQGPTHPQTPLDIRFGDAIQLRGYDLTARRLSPGERITVTWHWRVLRPMAEGFRQETQLAGALTGPRLELDQAGVLARVHPPTRWKTGQYLKDPQAFNLPPDWLSKRVHLLVGFRDGETWLEVTKGRHDGNHRALITIPLVDEAASEAVEQLSLSKRTGALRLDGRLDEPDWQTAAHTGRLVNTMQGAPGSFPADVRGLYDGDAIYVAFQVEDADLRASQREHDDHLWEQDVVEVMLDPDGDARNYFEIQVSPRNIVFDTRYDRRRQPRPFGHMDWDSHVDSAVHLDGTLDDELVDRGYTVEMRIPVDALVADGIKSPVPAPGTHYRMNFFVMDRRARGQRAVGWSPPLVGDFHTLQRFGEVHFLP